MDNSEQKPAEDYAKVKYKFGENDWSKVRRAADGNFACEHCKGTKVIHLPAWKNLSEETRDCISCHGTGYLIERVMLTLGGEKNQTAQYYADLLILKDWIKKNSQCKTCFGDQMKTLGGCPCKECGLEGRQPWGG